MATRLIEPADADAAFGVAPADPKPLPPILGSAYKETLEEQGWLADAHTAPRSDNGLIGGRTLQEVKEHFCARFSGSCARVLLALLDPRDQLGDASNTLVSAFSGGRLAILDIPCGAGAASAALLSGIATLRSARALPQQPLDVFLTGGEWSEPGRQLTLDLWSTLTDRLAENAIFLRYGVVPWDVFDPSQTTDCLNAWVSQSAAGVCTTHLILVANTSGFLYQSGKWKEAEPQLREIMRWAWSRSASVVWVEPQMNETRGLWPAIVGMCRKAWPKALRALHLDAQDARPETQAQFVHPLRTTESFTTRLTILCAPDHQREPRSGGSCDTDVLRAEEDICSRALSH